MIKLILTKKIKMATKFCWLKKNNFYMTLWNEKKIYWDLSEKFIEKVISLSLLKYKWEMEIIWEHTYRFALAYAFSQVVLIVSSLISNS